MTKSGFRSILLKSSRELYAAVPGIRKSLLGQNAKQFGERFHHLQKRISRHSSLASLEGTEVDDDEKSESTTAPSATRSQPGQRSREPSVHSESEDEGEPRIPMGGIANTHFQACLKILKFHLTAKSNKCIKCSTGFSQKGQNWRLEHQTGVLFTSTHSGGLVSCVDPVMTKDHENIWLANLGMNLKDRRK
ncbi:unnamed protein product [Strongylus vulgaris]|uniref:Uncharacterized protein n=1 Tax=Strongylus vulgaris TaxID=40348 RepID=A0A3P7IAC3_STRVU|nr:unnamed protein product [Strongylus vulgaris]